MSKGITMRKINKYHKNHSSDLSNRNSSSNSFDSQKRYNKTKTHRQTEEQRKHKKESPYINSTDNSIDKSYSSVTRIDKRQQRRLKRVKSAEKIERHKKPIRKERERLRDKYHSKWDSRSPERNRKQRSRSRHRERNHIDEQNSYSKKKCQQRLHSKDHDERNNGHDYRRDVRSREQYSNSTRHERSYNDHRELGKRYRSRSQSRSRSRCKSLHNYRRQRYRSPHQRYSSNYRTQRARKNSTDKNYEWGKKMEKHKKLNKTPIEKEKPNYGLSGALTEDANKVNNTVLKYAEPPEARKPRRRWRLYPFKGETALPTLHIHRQSCFLVGRERRVVDLAVDHPSCSKQHAVLQYRLVPFQREDGSEGKRVRLYLLDLESANGTFLNNKKIQSRKYYELFEKDVIKFGFSTREYVLLHENSKQDQEDDDVTIKEEKIE